jgi:hypothetical protein
LPLSMNGSAAHDAAEPRLPQGHERSSTRAPK